MSSFSERAARRIRRASSELFSTPQAPVYLVSAAGQPNFGDEFITRSWLDWLAEHHPQREVWIDTIEPGRASHLFRDTHPRLRVTNTLWHAAHSGPADDIDAVFRRIKSLICDLGSPRYDLGLRDLRGMASIHLLGGGYMNSIWPENLGVIAAMKVLKTEFGIRIFATGQGLMPNEGPTREWMQESLRYFDFIESRDSEGAEAFGIAHGVDDAFLAFANKRPIYAPREGLPQAMVLVQGDMLDPQRDAEFHDAVEIFVREQGLDGEVGFAEGIPPDDARYAGKYIEDSAPFYPFMRIWEEGFPAFAGQSWLTSRFHFHLLAAAAGARGAVLDAKPGYYDVKHASLQKLGTGWGSWPAPEESETHSAPASGAAPTADPTFPAVARELSRDKVAVARRLYPARP